MRIAALHIVGALVLLLSGTLAAAAQAVCSAPHSSPALAQGGTIRTLPSGSGWLQLSAYAQNTDERFDWTGAAQPFLADGEASTRSVYLTAAIGVARGLDVWGQAAVHRLRYSDQGGARERTGLGDVRFAARLSAAAWGSHVPLSIRAALKLPGSSFPVDATILPLSEGQRDVELALESGHALDSGRLYVLGWLGHRWRGEDESTRRDPGDEWFGHLAAGGAIRAVRWELGVEGITGAAPAQQGVRLPSDRRRLLQLTPALALAVAGGELNLGVQVPLAGRNLPRDPGISAGYRWSW